MEEFTFERVQNMFKSWNFMKFFLHNASCLLIRMQASAGLHWVCIIWPWGILGPSFLYFPSVSFLDISYNTTLSLYPHIQILQDQSSSDTFSVKPQVPPTGHHSLTWDPLRLILTFLLGSPPLVIGACILFSMPQWKVHEPGPSVENLCLCTGHSTVLWKFH